MDGTILVVGASGKFAGLVVPELARGGANIRAMIHDTRDESAVRETGAQDIVVGDLTDPASVATAQGVGRVFYIAPVTLPGEAKVGKAFVDAAIAAGVRRVVFSSVIHPVLSSLPSHALKAPVEDAVLAAGSMQGIRRCLDGGNRVAAHNGGATKTFSGKALSTTSRNARTLAPTRRRELCNAQISTGGPACVPQ